MAIHIKPENRGKFNATKKRTGKTTEQLTHSKNPLTRKRAIFAQNAKKWKHADGGYLENPLKPLRKFDDPVVERQFRKWYDKTAKSRGWNPDPNTQDYDIRRYWIDNKDMYSDVDNWSLPVDIHFPDRYKLPGHPAMSVESIYQPVNERGYVWDRTSAPEGYEEYRRPETDYEWNNRRKLSNLNSNGGNLFYNGGPDGDPRWYEYIMPSLYIGRKAGEYTAKKLIERQQRKAKEAYAREVANRMTNHTLTREDRDYLRKNHPEIWNAYTVHDDTYNIMDDINDRMAEGKATAADSAYLRKNYPLVYNALTLTPKDSEFDGTYGYKPYIEEFDARDSEFDGAYNAGLKEKNKKANGGEIVGLSALDPHWAARPENQYSNGGNLFAYGASAWNNKVDRLDKINMGIGALLQNMGGSSGNLFNKNNGGMQSDSSLDKSSGVNNTDQSPVNTGSGAEMAGMEVDPGMAASYAAYGGTLFDRGGFVPDRNKIPNSLMMMNDPMYYGNTMYPEYVELVSKGKTREATKSSEKRDKKALKEMGKSAAALWTGSGDIAASVLPYLMYNTVDFASPLIKEDYYRAKEAVRNKFFEDNKKGCGGKLHCGGGNLFDYGGDFSNGQTMYNTGGTHEENPYEGVQVGTDNQGTPNLVEEGEVRYNDYIFSNRLSLSPELAEKYNIPKKYSDTTFAYIAEKMGEESKEREYDPISKRGLKVDMEKLKAAQEEARAIKAQEEQMQQAQQYAEELGVPVEDVLAAMQLQQQEQQGQEQQQISPEEMAMMQQQQAEQIGQMPQQEQYAEQEIPADYASEEAPYAFGGKLHAYGGPDGEPTFLERLTGKQRPDYTYPEEPVYNGGELSPVTVEAERTWGKSPYDVSYDTTKFTGNPYNDYLSYSVTRSNLEAGAHAATLEPNWLDRITPYLSKRVKNFNDSEVRKELMDNMNKELEKQAKKYNMTVSKFRSTPMGRKIRLTYQEYANKAINEMFQEKQKAYALGGTLFDYQGMDFSNPQRHSTLFDTYANKGYANKYDTGTKNVNNPDDPPTTTIGLLESFLSDEDFWDKTARVSLDSIIKDFSDAYNKATTNEQRNTLRAAFIKDFNNLQKSYAVARNTSNPKVFSKAVAAHQKLFSEFRGNKGNLGFKGVEKWLKKGNRKILKDTTKAGFTPDGHFQVETRARHLGTNQYGDKFKDYYASLNDILNPLGIKYGVLDDEAMRYNDNGKQFELNGLSEFTPEEVPSAASVEKPVQESNDDYRDRVREEQQKELRENVYTGPTLKNAEDVENISQTTSPVNPTNQTNPANPANSKNPGDKKNLGAGLLAGAIKTAYDIAPLFASGKVDYSQPDALVDFTNSFPKPTYRPIGDFVQPHPFDVNYEANQQDQQNAALLRSNWNNSGGNRGYAGTMNIAGALSGQLANADMRRKAGMYNFTQNLQAAEFNRGTNKYNADAFNRVELAMPSWYNLGLRSRTERAREHYMIDKDKSAADSTNFDTMRQAYYDQIREAKDRRFLKWYIDRTNPGAGKDYPYPEDTLFDYYGVPWFKNFNV